MLAMRRSLARLLTAAVRPLFGTRGPRQHASPRGPGRRLRPADEMRLEDRLMPGDTVGGFFVAALGILPGRDPVTAAEGLLGGTALVRTAPTQDGTGAYGATSSLLTTAGPEARAGASPWLLAGPQVAPLPASPQERIMNQDAGRPPSGDHDPLGADDL